MRLRDLLFAAAAAAGGRLRAAADGPVSGEAPSEHLDLDDNTVTVGRSHACALERVDELSIGGEIVCWGDSLHGQLNPPPGLFVQLSAAEHTTCGVSIEERVVCWGSDEAVVAPAATGGKGSAAADDPDRPRGRHNLLARHPATRAAADVLATTALLQVSVGGRHACALRSGSGKLFCWGDDSHGQVSAAPLDVAFAQVSCGGDACCGLVRDAAVASSEEDAGDAEGVPAAAAGGFALRCWGAEFGGVQEHPRGADAPRFLQVSVAGDGHACGVAADYRLYCWGSFVGPTGGLLSWNGTFVQVATAEGLSCALRADGTLFCLGEERRLWSGRPARGRRDLPPPPPPPARNTQFSEVSAHGINVCGVTAGAAARRVLCWGETRDISTVPHDLEPAGLPQLAAGGEGDTEPEL